MSEQDTDTTASTDVALPSERQAAEAAQARENVQQGPANMPATELVVWAMEARQAHQIAISLAQTDFVPKAMRNKPDQVTGAILTGNELGLKPMAALRSIDVIQGTPAIRAHAMRALVLQAGHKMVVVETDDQRCVMKGRRKDDPEDEWTTVTWTIQRAQRAGLTTKDVWQQFPDDMLLARATSQLARLIAADLLLGVPYSAEEVRDMDDPTMANAGSQRVQLMVSELTGQQPPAAPPAVAAASPAAPEPEPKVTKPPKAKAEPAADEPHDAEVVPEHSDAVPATEPAASESARPSEQLGVDPMEPMITPRQIGAVHSLAKKLGLETREGHDRTEYLAELEAILGRYVATSKDITAVEAGRVIEALQETVDKAPPATAGEPSEPQRGGGWG